MGKKMGKILCLSFCIILAVPLVRAQTYTSVINIASGPVKGLISKTIENVDYSAFKGIPYAKPPIADLRFKPPVEVDSWTDTYYATNEGSMCIQYNSTDSSAVGSEDCLYINVYTPHTEFDDSIKKPVMVWFYGGAFISGLSDQAHYGPDFILGQDVIMVSFNYRVGAFGFLNLEHENATGNCGLKDQNLALKWVKRNIAQFGGDPDKITIFGQSAGSVSVDLQVLSDMSAGLFKQSISMSGSTLCLYWGLQSGVEAVQQAFILGMKLGINTFRKDKLLKTLHSVSANDIVIAANDIGLIPFRPTIEKTNIATGQEKFLTECSLKKYITGNYTKGPHMVGFVANETISFAENMDDLLTITELALDMVGSADSNIPFLSNLKNAVTTGISNQAQDSIKQFGHQTTDLFFILGIDTKQRLISHNNNHPIYYYRFSFDANCSWHKAIGVELQGTGHGDELPYILYMPAVDLPLNRPDIATTRQRLVKLWTNFAKYGNPTPNGKDDEVLGITWPDSCSSGVHLDINKELTTGPRPTNEAVKSLQSSRLGASPVLNDCTNSVLSGVMNSLVSIIGLVG